MKSGAFALGETALLLVSLVFGRVLSQTFDLVPKFIGVFHVSTLVASDWQTMIMHFGFWSILTFTVSHLSFGHAVFSSARRAAIELFALVVALTFSAISLFLLSTINFDPELFIGTALSAGLLFAGLHVVGRPIMEEKGGFGLWDSLKGLVGQAFAVLGKWKPFPFAIAVLAFALTPVLMAKAFKEDRAFAAQVTKLRVMLNSNSDFPYVAVRAWPGVTFRQAMMVRFSKVDPTQAYILERHGRLHRLDTDNPAETKELLLDFSTRVKYVEIELGALGFDLHPDFDDVNGAEGSNQYAYIMYTDFIENESQYNRLSRFDLSLPTPEERMASELVLWELDRNPDGWHNGGSVDFGPDGFLYAAIGDALDAEGWQKIDRAFMGTIIRIDVDQVGGDVSHAPKREPHNGSSGNYYIPSDNPFVGVPNANEEIYALGLRNPFRISFDPETGNLWAGDVGSTKWEEVNLIEPGGNYQYPFIEGYEPTGKERPDKLVGTEVEPIHSYIHTAYERAVIGGLVYRGERYPDLYGKYLFADNYSGHLYTLDATGEKMETAPIIGQVQQFAQQGVTSLVTDPNGDILITTLGDFNNETGEVLRLLPALEADEYLKQEGVSDPKPLQVAASDIDAAGLYQNYCERCHGRSGDGKDSDMIEFGYVMPDFTTEEYHQRRSREFIRKIIADGGGQEGVSEMMPPWEMLLEDAEIDALVDYLEAMPEAAGE